MARLVLIDKGKLQEIQMGQELTIGRAYSNLLRLEGEEISRVHGIIYRRGDDYIVRDLDSKNGLLLNGQKVMNSLLSPGDEVQIGSYFVIFEPATDFDLNAFVRKHNFVMPSTMSAMDDDKNADTSITPDSSMDPVEATNDVFFQISTIESMAQPQSAPLSMEFLSDLLRMHRRLGRDPVDEDPDQESRLYQHFLNVAMGALAADRGVIVLKDDTGEVLRLGAIFPKDKDVAVNRVVLKNVLREKKVVLCNDVQKNANFARTETIKKDNIGSLIAYPLMNGKDSVGLIYADTIGRDMAFRRDQLLILHFLCRILMLCMIRSDLD